MSESLPADNSIDSKMENLKIRSESKPLEFSDLTTDVLKVIIEKSELKERLILRKVSRGLRDLVDQQKSIWSRINFEFHVDYVCAEFDNNYVVYTDPKVDLKKCTSTFLHRHTKIIRSDEYLKMALDDLQFALKDPKLQLHLLSVQFFSSHWIHLEKFTEGLDAILKSIPHKISTERFQIRAPSADQILAILPYLKPGTLHSIEFSQRDTGWIISADEFEQIADLDQWKQAKKLGLRFASEMWPEKHLMHFEEFHIFDWCLGAEKFRRWRDLFSRSKNFSIGYAMTKGRLHPSQILNHNGDGVLNLTTHPSYPIYAIEHPLLNDPNQYLEIEVDLVCDCITFKKLSRQSS